MREGKRRRGKVKGGERLAHRVGGERAVGAGAGGRLAGGGARYGACLARDGLGRSAALGLPLLLQQPARALDEGLDELGEGEGAHLGEAD